MLSRVFTPRSVAVVGVSKDPHKVGHQIFVNLQSFTGPVYPVHPTEKTILGKKVYSSLLSIPDAVDLVIIATPGSLVENIIAECVDKKVGAVAVIAAGFAETSAKGQQVQDRIARTCSLHGIHLIGPNTLGLANPHLDLNATFARNTIDAGSIALISQSGAMLTTLFEELASRSIGCSFALSLGNTAGITPIDALTYAQEDPQTKVIALYLESLPPMQEFFLLTKQISKTKPILILKGGMTDEGQHASLSHTAALATSGILLQAASRQMGFVLVDTVEQFFESMFFLDQLLAKTTVLPSTTMIITNAGGPGVNAVDLASNLDVPLATWSPTSIQRFAAHLPRVRPSNPTDLLGDAQTTDIMHALAFATEDPRIESMILILTPQAVTDIPGITAAITKEYTQQVLFDHEHYKPLLVALMGGEGHRDSLRKLRQAGICAVEYANEAVEIASIMHRVRTAQHVDRSAAILQQLAENPAIDPDYARRAVPVRAQTINEALLLLEDYAIPLPRTAIVTQASQLDALEELDPTRVFPLIAKTGNLKLKHKALVGGVVTGITSIQQARAAYTQLSRLGKTVVLQEVITHATELIIGAKRDAIYGTFIAVGAGGSLTNIMADRQYAFLPASHRELRDTLKATKIVDALTAEQQSLVVLVLERIQRLMSEHPEVQELEINPVMVTDHAIYAVDVKMDLTLGKTPKDSLQ